MCGLIGRIILLDWRVDEDRMIEGRAWGRRADCKQDQGVSFLCGDGTLRKTIAGAFVCGKQAIWHSDGVSMLCKGVEIT